MPIPDEEQGTQQYEDEQQSAALANLIAASGLSREFVVWYLHKFGNDDAVTFSEKYGGTETKNFATSTGHYKYDVPSIKGAVELLKSEYASPATSGQFAKWQQEIGQPLPSETGRREAAQQGIQFEQRPLETGQGLGTWLSDRLMGLGLAGGTEEAGGADTQGTPGGALVSSVGDVFTGLTSEELQGLGAEGITEKFGLQRLAIEEPEAFLQAMFDKAGISPSPPVYGFLRDLMPSLVLLASTREGQDIINSPGGAVQLNTAINEVISQGYPSRGSILQGLQAMGGLGRAFLGEGASDQPRTEFTFIAATLNDLIGPTMSEPLRRALFNTKAIETQGDRFLSAAGRGVYQGGFIDWLKDQGYPIPQLAAYTPTPGATEQAGAGTTGFVAAEGGATGTSTTGAPTFQVKGGVYGEK